MAGNSLIGALRIALGLDTVSFETGAKKADQKAKGLAASISKQLLPSAEAASAALNRLAGSFGGIAAAYAGIEGARKLLEYADAAKTITAQLKLATQSFGSLAQAQSDVNDIATKTRSGLEDTTKLYATFIRAASTTGYTQEQAAKATQTFSETLKISGANTEEASAATLQFSQALASGKLQGDEFRSLMENSPRTMKAVADSLGINVGQLKALSTQGKLTGDVLFKAFSDRKFTDTIDKEFQELPTTIGQAMTLVENAAIEAIGEFDDGGQFSTAIANFITSGTTGFSDLTTSAQQFGIDTRAVFDGLGHLFDPLGENGKSVFDALGIHIASAQDQIAGLLDIVDQVRNVFIDLNNWAVGFDKKWFPNAINTQHEQFEQRSNFAGTFLQGFNQSRAAAQARVAKEQANAKKNNGAGTRQAPAPAASKSGANTAAKAAADAKRAAEKERRDQRAYEADLARTRSDYLGAMEQLTPEIVQQSQLQRQELADSTRAAMERVDTDERYNEQQKKALKLKIGEVASLQSQLIDQRQRQQLAEQAFKSAQQDRDNQADYLKAQEDLARTAKQRLDLELRILNIQHDSERAAQLDIINDTTNRYSADDKQQAQRQIAHIDQVFPLQKAAVVQQNQGPLGQYLDALPKSADDMNEALQKVTTDGLDGLTDGISQAITGARSLGSVFKNVANQIIADLARIAVEKSVIGPLGNVLSSLLGTNSINPLSLDSPALNIGGSIPTSMSVTPITAALAGGGPVVGGKNYLVGEQGPEIFTPDHSGSIISNDNIPMSSRGDVHQTFNIPSGVDLATRTEMVAFGNVVKQQTIAVLKDQQRRSAGR